MSLDLFSPFGISTTAVSVSGTTGSGSLSMPGASSDLSASQGTTRSFKFGGVSVRVFNSTGAIVFIAFGDSTITATTSSMPIPAGGVEVFQVGPGITHIAGITGGGTGTLYATIGMGA